MAAIVIKLGGSLSASRKLRDWLDAACALDRRVVVVPGGGPFAEAVRAAQPALGFGDGAAHAMAILAMEQYGHALLDLEPRLARGATRDGLARAKHALWMPARMAIGADDIRQSWEVTSDSLAAWLAAEIEAAALILVKSAPRPEPGSDAADWARDGLVDPAFPAAAARFGGPVACLGAADHGALAETVARLAKLLADAHG